MNAVARGAPLPTDSLHRLWDALADFPVTDSEEATAFLMAALAERIGAWNATWAGAICLGSRDGDPLAGWRVGAVQALKPVGPLPEEGHFKEILRHWDRREIDPSFLLPMRAVGSFRSYSFRRELDAAWFETPFYHRYYGAAGTHDAAFVAFPLNDDSESHFGFYARRRFTDAEIGELEAALRGIKWFHRRLMLSRGLLVASAPLTPAERRVLAMLLTRASEKEIAHGLEMAASTAHQHVKSIFRKYGVTSRAGLMSLWLAAAA